MKDLRMWLGNAGSKHTGTLLERCALLLVQRKNQRNLEREAVKVHSTKSNEHEDKEELYVDAVFCEVFVFATETRLFGPGEPLHCAKRTSSKERGEGEVRAFKYGPYYESGEFTSICDKKVRLNKEMLRIFSIGKGRLADYFDVFLRTGDFDDPFRPEDDENGVSLKSVKPLEEDAQHESKMKIVRSTSTKFEVLDQNYLARDLVDEIHYLNEVIGDDGPHEEAGGTKEENIAKVIVLRLRMKAKNKEWADEREQMVEEEIERQNGQDVPIETIMEEELNNSFFMLDHFTCEKALALHTFKRELYIEDDNMNADEGDNTSINADEGDNTSIVPGLESDESAEEFEAGTDREEPRRNSLGLSKFGMLKDAI